MACGFNRSTFIVTDGAAALGCLGGTTTETFRSPVAVSSITRVMSCTSGGTGTITLNFYPLAGIPGPGDDNCRWTIIDGTGDFQGLYGEGAFTGFYSDDFASAFNIPVGKIHRSP